ncbi:MAG: PilZ domain-containing protein [Terriglobales bacterium]
MHTVQGQLERRAAQRFEFQLPVSVHLLGSNHAGKGFTQNLSASGALVCTDLSLTEADTIELTLIMPSEITLGENMRVRCRGRVLRVQSSNRDAKYATAIHLENYEFLPEAEGVPVFRQISPLREHDGVEVPVS